MIVSNISTVVRQVYLSGEWKEFCDDKINYWKNLFSRQLCSDTNSNFKDSFDISMILKEAARLKETV